MKRSLLLSGSAILLAVLALAETAARTQDQSEWRFFVAGEVKRPGSFDRGKQLTLRQAIALAEGTTFKADPQNTIIVRQDPNSGELLQIKIDLKAVARGQAEDVLLLPDDVIIVPKQRPKTER